jgi:hypothetical protein
MITEVKHPNLVRTNDLKMVVRSAVSPALATLWFILFFPVTPAHAGMTVYDLTDVARLRLEDISFFAFLLLLATLGIRLPWFRAGTAPLVLLALYASGPADENRRHFSAFHDKRDDYTTTEGTFSVTSTTFCISNSGSFFVSFC